MPKKTFFNLSEEKKQPIIDVAIDEFSNASFNEVKISTIIARAEIPRSSFYDYFLNKKDIYLFILGLIGQKKKEYFDLVDDDLPFFQHLQAYLKASSRFMAMESQYDKIGKYLYNDSNLLKEILGENQSTIDRSFEHMIIKGINNSVLRPDIDVELTAETLRILTSQLLINSINKSDVTIEEAISKITDHTINFIKSGIGL